MLRSANTLGPGQRDQVLNLNLKMEQALLTIQADRFYPELATLCLSTSTSCGIYRPFLPDLEWPLQ